MQIYMWKICSRLQYRPCVWDLSKSHTEIDKRCRSINPQHVTFCCRKYRFAVDTPQYIHQGRQNLQAHYIVAYLAAEYLQFQIKVKNKIKKITIITDSNGNYSLFSHRSLYTWTNSDDRWPLLQSHMSIHHRWRCWVYRDRRGNEKQCHGVPEEIIAWFFISNLF